MRGAGQQPNVFAQRVKAAREALALTQSTLAVRLGVSLRTWQNYETGSSAPDMKILASLVAEGVNPRWLMLGERPVLSAPPAIEGPEGTQADPQEFVYLPYFPAAVSAGPGRFVLEEPEPVPLAFRREWVKRELGLAPGTLMLLPVVGDSMTPTLRDGEILLIEKRKDLPMDGIYVLGQEGGMLVKRVQKLPGGVVQISSDNPVNASFTVSDGDPKGIRVIGRAIWCMTGRRL